MIKTAKLIRTTLLTGFCAGLMTGCSWLDDWPPGGSEMATKSAPKPPESRIMQTSEGTWIEPGKEVKEVEAKTAKGIKVDPASADRITQLETSLEEIRNDLNMMMPALTKLAEAQGDIQKNLAQVEPASGPGAAIKAPAPIVAQPVVMPLPGAGWYEAQEKQNRAQGNNAGNGAGNASWNNPAPVVPAPVVQQQPYQQQAYQQQQPPQYQQQPNYPPQNYQQQQTYQQPYQQAYQQPPAYQPPPYQPPPSNQAYRPPAGMQQNVAAAYAPSYQPAPQAASAPTSVAPPPATAQPASYGGGGEGASAVTNVRVGEHTDKTRLVLDTSDKVSFSYDVDNNEKILVIELPGSGWQGAQDMQIGSSPLIESYHVIPDDSGGHQVIMQLKQPVQVLWAQALPPGGPQGHRVVFDLVPL